MAIEDFFALDSQIQYILGGIVIVDLILVFIFLRVTLHAVNAFKMDGKNRILTMLFIFIIDLIIGVLFYAAYIELESTLTTPMMLGFWIIVLMVFLLIGGIIIKYRHQTTLWRGIFAQLIMAVFIGILDLLIIFVVQFGMNIDLFNSLLQLIQDFL